MIRGLERSLKMIFKVERLKDEEIFYVYDIIHNKDGDIFFLIYDEHDEIWTWVNAKYFRPY